MICQKCGSVIADGSLICPECGGTARSSASGQSEVEETVGRGLTKYEIQLARKRAFSSPKVIVGIAAYIFGIIQYFCCAPLYRGMESDMGYSKPGVISGESLIILALSLTIIIPGILMAIGLTDLYTSFSKKTLKK